MKESDPKQFHLLNDLITKKQIVFAQGGLSIYDEATTHYDDIIDQMRYGVRKIYEMFGIKINNGWALDAFGQSFTNTFILKNFGVKSFVFDRLNDYERNEREQKNGMFEFFWGELFTHILPHSFCEDIHNYFNKDDLEKMIYNVSLLSKDPQEIMLVFSDDFKRWNNSDFEKIEEQINFFQNNTDINMFFSSAENYFQALMVKHKNTSNLLKDQKESLTDFFPLVGPLEKRWVGFYSTRPNLKYMIKKFGVASRSLKNMFAILMEKGLKFKKETNFYCIEEMEKQIGFLIHHDTTAGTIAHLSDSSVRNQTIFIEDNCKAQLENETVFSSKIFCPIQENNNSCILDYFANNNEFEHEFETGMKTISLNIFNPRQGRADIITFRIPDINMKVFRSDGSHVDSDTFCENFDGLECFLMIKMEFGGFKFENLIINFGNNGRISRKLHIIDINHEKIIDLDLEFPALIKIEPNFKRFSYISHEMKKVFTLNYKYYESKKFIFADQDPKGYAGAYVMKLENGKAIDFKKEMNMEGFYFRTTFFTRIIIKYGNSSIISRLTIYNEKNKSKNKIQIDISTFLNKNLPIDYLIQSGREIIFSIRDDNLMNNGEFSTDSNGLHMIQRHRKVSNGSDANNIPSNYYPVVSKISINNEKTLNAKDYLASSMTIFNDRSQGGTSYREGEIELLINRFFETDDSLGLFESIKSQEEMYLNHKIVFHDYRSQTPKDEETMKIGHNNNFMYLSFFEGLDAILSKSEDYRSMLSDILNDCPNFLKINLHPISESQILIYIQDIVHESNEETIRLAQNLIKQIQNICDHSEKCFSCKETLLDGFRDLSEKEQQYRDPHEIITLSCVKTTDNQIINIKKSNDYFQTTLIIVFLVILIPISCCCFYIRKQIRKKKIYEKGVILEDGGGNSSVPVGELSSSIGSSSSRFVN